MLVRKVNLDPEIQVICSSKQLIKYYPRIFNRHMLYFSEKLSEIQQSDQIQLRCGTQAAGWYADQWVALVDQRRLTKL